MRIETFAEQLFFVTVRVETEKFFGTAFFYQIDNDGHRGTFIVTNKHLLVGSDWIRLTFHHGDGPAPVLGATHVAQLKTDIWFLHPQEEIDVAVLPLGCFASEAEQNGWKIFLKAVTKESQPTENDLEQFDAIEDVVYVGCPNNLFDRENHLPVIRRGITATPLDHCFENRPVFLIDGSVFPGSSGSPVFALNQGSYKLRSGDFVVGSRVLFLGVIAEFRYREADGWFEYNDAVVSGAKVAFQESIDLGIVYRESAIRETIHAFLQSVGSLP